MTEFMVLDIPTRGSQLSASAVITDSPALAVLVRGRPATRRGVVLDGVASALRSLDISTLTIDLLTRDDAAAIPTALELANRLDTSLDWIAENPEFAGMPTGLVGVGVASGLVIRAAADHKQNLRALVVIGGELEVPRQKLRLVNAPTLLLLDHGDQRSIRTFRDAQADMRGPTELHVMPGGSLSNANPRVDELVTTWLPRHAMPIPPPPVEAAVI